MSVPPHCSLFLYKVRAAGRTENIKRPAQAGQMGCPDEAQAGRDSQKGCRFDKR